jgi:hypothetical protein
VLPSDDDTTDEHLDLVLGVNWRGVFACSQEAARATVASGVAE